MAWSKEDVRNLKTLAKARMSGPKIAKKLKRTPGAVSQKALKLGVRFRPVRRARRVEVVRAAVNPRLD